jgi:hypothetical protein
MAVKGRRRTSRKSTRGRRKTRRNRSYRKRGQCIRGGNYEKDVTTRYTEGVPTKPLNKFVVTVPGYPAMSGVSYKLLAEEIDRDGPDAFLK